MTATERPSPSTISGMSACLPGLSLLAFAVDDQVNGGDEEDRDND